MSRWTNTRFVIPVSASLIGMWRDDPSTAECSVQTREATDGEALVFEMQRMFPLLSGRLKIDVHSIHDSVAHRVRDFATIELTVTPSEDLMFDPRSASFRPVLRTFGGNAATGYKLAWNVDAREQVIASLAEICALWTLGAIERMPA